MNKKNRPMILFDFLQAVKNCIKRLPLIRQFVQNGSWYTLRHKILLFISERNNYTDTRFLRIPAQYSALSGSVIDFLIPKRTNDMLRIIVAGCSIGAEAYTIASVLNNKRSNLPFKIIAFDIEQDVITKARKAIYERDEIFVNNMLTQEFVKDTFDLINGHYKVKMELLDHVKFVEADALNSNLQNMVGTADILFAQNFLFHLKRKLARKAFDNLYRLLNDKAVLFIDGMDLDLRVSLTRKYGLDPLSYNLEQIHEEARQLKGSQWPWIYWGLEPFSKQKKDCERKYSTIFFKDMK